MGKTPYTNHSTILLDSISRVKKLFIVKYLKECRYKVKGKTIWKDL